MKSASSGTRPNLFRFSAAMTGETNQALRAHLLRDDGQEDLCMAVYRPSTGATRQTAILTDVILPLAGETTVHGNVSFTGSYVLRAIQIASELGAGLAILHSHPGAFGWQRMSRYDKDAEASYANVTREITGLPLVGMTLAGADGAWSARFWNRGAGRDVSHVSCENVRVIGERLTVTWNDELVPPPRVDATQTGTIGLEVSVRLAATGLQTVASMDFDSMKLINLDRMPGATELDVWLDRSKIEVALRLMRENATARPFSAVGIEGSVCEPEQFAQALDYDLIFCCIDDHPWPRSIANAIAYSDLIPVVDGGIHVDAFADGDGMRNATWRSHVLRPGRPCMACNGQLDLGDVQADRAGLLEDKEYIAGLPPSARPQSQNVAALSVSATASLLAQFVSFVVAPAGLGDPGPLRYSLSTHTLEHVSATTRQHCPVERGALAGDQRQVLLGEHAVARAETSRREHSASRPVVVLARAIDRSLTKARALLTNRLGHARNARRRDARS
jgi:hypothetical protein